MSLSIGRRAKGSNILYYLYNKPGENKGSFLLLTDSCFWRISVIDVATQTRHTLKSVALK